MEDYKITLTRGECECLFGLTGRESSRMRFLIESCKKEEFPKAYKLYVETEKLVDGIYLKLIEAVYGNKEESKNVER